MFDVFNTIKYNILSAIEILNSNGEVANLASVREYTKYSTETLGFQLGRLRKDLIIASYDQERTNGCTLKYKLSKQGKHILRQYQERHANGYDLRLRKVPKKMDWSQFELLPGLKAECQ